MQADRTMPRKSQKIISAAEKQRLYRQRRDADETRREVYLQKERDAWKRKVQLKKWKPMSEINDREQSRDASRS